MSISSLYNCLMLGEHSTKSLQLWKVYTRTSTVRSLTPVKTLRKKVTLAQSLTCELLLWRELYWVYLELAIMEHSCQPYFQESSSPQNRNILTATCAKPQQSELLTAHKDSFVKWFRRNQSITIPVSHRYFRFLEKKVNIHCPTPHRGGIWGRKSYYRSYIG